MPSHPSFYRCLQAKTLITLPLPDEAPITQEVKECKEFQMVLNF